MENKSINNDEGSKRPQSQNENNNARDAEWRAHVQEFSSNAEFPFETNEIVWIVKPSFRAPLGEFRISRAFPDDTFELVKVSDNTIYHERVRKEFLKRDPFRIGH